MEEQKTDRNYTKDPLVILTGPTAVGKTALSIALAKSLDGEIISADSMQVYRHMDIGSAKISREEMSGVVHHLIDICEPTEEYNVVAFQKACRNAIQEILGRGKLPLLVGGTGFYIQAVLRDIDFTENREEPEYRRALEREASVSGPASLHDRLQRVDPEAAAQIPPSNVKRVIRALEYFHLTGEKISEHNARERMRENAYNACYFVLDDDRNRLYERIDARVDGMLAQGLVEEVKMLKKMGCARGMTSMQGIGYKEILDYLNGECTLEEAVSLIKRDTRHFAKRQLTWFRREPEVIWVHRENFPVKGREEVILNYMLEQIRERIKES